MTCGKCNESGILNSANGQEFYYCRTCKIEISLEVVDNEAPYLSQSKSTQKNYADVSYTDEELDEIAAWFGGSSTPPGDML